MTGAELREIRKALNLSQKDFSEELGVKLRTMTNLEKSDDIGKLYQNAVSFLVFKAQREKLVSASDELMDLIQ